jgi:hypothetical protein
MVMEADPNRLMKSVWPVNSKSIGFAPARTEGSDFNLWD